jgi:hypothetical protein
MAKIRSLTDQIRDAVKASQQSRYSLCKATGIDRGSMSRFMSRQQGLSSAALDALAAVLKLRIVSDQKGE